MLAASGESQIKTGGPEASGRVLPYIVCHFHLINSKKIFVRYMALHSIILNPDAGSDLREAVPNISGTGVSQTITEL